MAVETPLLDLAFQANADLQSVQFYLCKLTAANTVGTCSATTDTALGVLQNKASTNQAAAVRILGVSKVVVDTSGVTFGSAVVPAANGKGTGQGVNGGSYAIGYALDTTTAANQVATVLLIHPGRNA